MLLRVLNQTFALVNGDIFTNLNFIAFNSVFKEFMVSHNLGSFIYLVKNPSQTRGDFDLKGKWYV